MFEAGCGPLFRYTQPRMENHSSVEAMAASYAEQAVARARQFQHKLDYSETSVTALEAILGQAAAQGPDLEESCKLWGCYFGEVIRRRYGGEWSIETYPGKQFATLTLTVGGHKLFPSMKVHRRLTQGEGESLAAFYAMVRSRLESLPGARVQ